MKRLMWCAIALGLASCGASMEYACGPATCEGCCVLGRCEVGTGSSACGLGGRECTGCGTAQVCSSNGACETAGTGGGSGTAGGIATGGGSAGGGSATGGGSAGGGSSGGGSATGGGTTVCMPETDAAFCARRGASCGSVTTFDNCGSSRTVNCGSCSVSATCVSGACCTTESDAAFCQRLQKNCGTVTGTDTCGLSRTASCGSCAGSQTCGGGGTTNVCGQNLCGVCSSPPAGTCTAPGVTTGYFKAKHYSATGTCSNPATGACSYASTTDTCAEDCRNGRCVETPCSIGGFECTTAHTGCKLTTASALRCLPVDTGGSEGMPCDDEVPGYRCDSYLQCVFPSFASTSICAHLCVTSADCAGVGLQNQHVCVRSTAAAYGWCR